MIEPTPFDPAVKNAWGPLLNTNMVLLDNWISGILALDVSGNTNVTLTSTQGAADQARNQDFVFSGALTGSISVFWPASRQRFFTVKNSTSGNFSLTIAVVGTPGTVVVVPQGSTVMLRSDGTNIAERFNEFVGGVALGTPLTAANGGTGRSTLAAHGVLVGAGTSAANVTGAGTAAQVLTSNGAAADPTFQDVPSQLPPGAVVPYAGPTAPTGWLLAFGQAVDRTTYAALFAVISTTFGIGDGSTTFNVPDLRGRFAAGADAMGGTPANRLGTGATGGITGSATVAAAGGEQAHAQVLAEVASHAHTVPGLSFSGSGTAITSGSKTTNYSVAGGSPLPDPVTTLNSGSVAISGTTGTGTSGTAGSGTAANVTPPVLVLNYIIKT